MRWSRHQSPVPISPKCPPTGPAGQGVPPIVTHGNTPSPHFTDNYFLPRLLCPAPATLSSRTKSSETSLPQLSLPESIWRLAEGESSHTLLLPPSNKSFRSPNKSGNYSVSWCSASRPMRSTFPFPHPGQRSPSRMSSFANETIMFLPPGNPQSSSPGARRSH